MPGDVYNLGRVNGLSAWEVYVRQSLILNPEIEPLSEREWLSETIGMGDSMLLKITKDNIDGVHCREYPLPAKSLLGAPRVVIGSFFYGEGVSDDDTWCKKVIDYGPEILNNDTSSPANGSRTAHSLPKSETDVDEITQRRMMQYVKIQDAILLQDGVWSDSETDAPKKNFVPDITKSPVLRINFRDKVNEDFYILLTGFVNRAIIKGEVGFDMGSVIPDDAQDASNYRPENGDFLGPTIYPWASKVVFTYPTALTSLMRDSIDHESDNIAILPDSDSPKTTVKLSKIEAGKGIQVDDQSKPGDPKPIVISSRIQSNNNYIEVVKQDQYNTDDGSSKIPTELKGSRATPAAGVGITQPANPGDPHIIGAKIAIDSERSKYLGISQSAPDDADLPATTLTPAYPEPGPGIAISDPGTPGGPFNISSIVKTAPENKNDADEDGSDYIRVDQVSAKNASTTTTTLKPSRAIPGRGVGISQPAAPGQHHKISSIMNTEGCGAKYLSITQPSNSNRSADDVSTTFTPSKIASKKGIAITQPATPGGDVTISSIIESRGSAKNYIKVEQEAHDTGCGCGCGDGQGADTVSTVLTPSRLIEENEDSRLVINQPATPGGDIRISTKISFTPHKGISILDDPKNGVTHIGSVIAIGGEGALGMDITQSSVLNDIDNASTTLIVSPLVVDPRNKAGTDANGNPVNDVLTISYSTSGGPITFFIDVDEIIRRMLKSGPLKNFIDDLLKKIYTGDQATVAEDGHITWTTDDSVKIPMANLNIYSADGEGDVFTDAIRSRSGNTSNDLRMK